MSEVAWLTFEEEAEIRRQVLGGITGDHYVSMINGIIYQSRNGQDYNALKRQSRVFAKIVKVAKPYLDRRSISVLDLIDL